MRLSCGKWYVSLQTEQILATPVHPDPGGPLGIDLGVARFAAFSSGETEGIKTPNLVKRFEKRLSTLQQSLSRKKKGSNNRSKAKKRLGLFYHRIRNIRLDFLHKATATISKNHADVVLEDLKVKDMTKSGNGNTGRNRDILSLSWYEFRRQLQYKLSWRGGRLHLVDPSYTSQTCPRPVCGHVSSENRKTQSVFHCVKCHFEANADHVGALNVLSRAGLARIACFPPKTESPELPGLSLCI